MNENMADQIYGARAKPLEPLHGGNKPALRAISIAKSLIVDLVCSDEQFHDQQTAVEYLDLAERHLS